MPKHINKLPEWDRVLSSASRFQSIFPDAVLVGGTSAAIHAGHRFSCDADHVMTDLRVRFDDILTHIESVAGWKTARVQRPVQILGRLDGIETGIRQLIRKEPLETIKINVYGVIITIPTEAEILRIKGLLILKRNATRDYLDFAALAEHMGEEKVIEALQDFDRLYPQENNESVLQQLCTQLANAVPYDLEETTLSEYKNLNPQWQDWTRVQSECLRVSMVIFENTPKQASFHLK